MANLPQPEVLSRNGSYMAYRRLQEHVGAFREYLATTPTPRKSRNCWRRSSWAAGAAARRWCWRPRRRSGTRRRPDAQQRLQLQGDGPARLRLPAGIACPAAQSARHRPQHEPPPDDPPRRHLRSGAARRRARRRGRPRHRGVHHLRQPGPPVRVRPERLDQRQAFHELGNEHDPICGAQDGTLDFTVPKRPIRKVHKGIPAFTTLTGGAYFFLPGLAALRYLASPRKRRTTMTRTRRRPHLQPGPHRPPARRAAPHEHLLDVELSMGGPAGSGGNGEPFLHHDRGTQRALARLRDARVRGGELPAGHRRDAGAVPSLRAGVPGPGRRGDRPPGRGVPARRPGRLRPTHRRAHPRRHRHPDGVRPRPPHLRAGGRTGRDRGDSQTGCAAKEPACCSRRTTTSASPTTSPSARWSTNTTATVCVPRRQRFSQYTRSLMRGLDVPIHNTWGLRPAAVDGIEGDRAADRHPRPRHPGLLDEFRR